MPEIFPRYPWVPAGLLGPQSTGENHPLPGKSHTEGQEGKPGARSQAWLLVSPAGVSKNHRERPRGEWGACSSGGLNEASKRKLRGTHGLQVTYLLTRMTYIAIMNF